MALVNMRVYNDEIAGLAIELLAQNIQLFNAASGGAIVLDSKAWRGNYTKESFFQSLASAQRRVDRIAANGAQAATVLSQGDVVGVKVAGGFGPVLFEPSQMTWLQQSPAEAIAAIAEGFADAMLADQVNTAVGAAVAAIENVPALVNDVSATGGLTQNVLNGSHAKFGDMSQMLITDVMTGATYHKLIDQALTNATQLFQSGNVTILEILGKRIVVSDIPRLYVAGTPNKAKVLSLTAGGIVVDNTSDIITNMDTVNGKQRIETTWQADYTFGLRLKGFAWDVAAGGTSPDDTKLFTGTNWDKAVSFDKHLAGTLAVGNADA
jgi:hypothetical protein